MMNLVKSIKMILKEEMGKELGPSHAAETKKIADVLNPETKMIDGTRTGAGFAAEVEIVDVIVKIKS